MKQPPREIEVHIEELVLHGFDPKSRWSVADALSSELVTLLSQRGVPEAWHSNPERIVVDASWGNHAATPQNLGREVAQAVQSGNRL